VSCLKEKVLLAGSLSGLAGAGVVVVVGAPTVVVSAAGVAAAIGALAAAVDALDRLAGCLRAQGKDAAVDRLQLAVDALTEQLAELREAVQPQPD
jgi:hypothetical protein